jgi:hypothetical protein
VMFPPVPVPAFRFAACSFGHFRRMYVHCRLIA